MNRINSESEKQISETINPQEERTMWRTLSEMFQFIIAFR